MRRTPAAVRSAAGLLMAAILAAAAGPGNAGRRGGCPGGAVASVVPGRSGPTREEAGHARDRGPPGHPRPLGRPGAARRRGGLLFGLLVHVVASDQPGALRAVRGGRSRRAGAPGRRGPAARPARLPRRRAGRVGGGRAPRRVPAGPPPAEAPPRPRPARLWG